MTLQYTAVIQLSIFMASASASASEAVPKVAAASLPVPTVVSAKSKKSMSLIASFARIKPLDVDKTGGARAQKQISSWDEAKGIVTFNKATGNCVFDHMSQVIGPDATQVHVYEAIARPLIHEWLNGYDVDIISYGQTGSGKTSARQIVSSVFS